jgi:oxalate decarboxylase/phosphoglucose isomerase-like protein (cupin superfamily)
MMQSQSKFVPKTSGATPFDQFLEWVVRPGVRTFVVGDIRKLEVAPWRRRGGLGCYIILGHPKEPPNSAAYICEIPPGESLKPQKQMFEEMIFVLKGHGATSVWLDNGKKQTFEWQERSMFSIPLNAWHQHFNGQGGDTVRYIGYTNAPSVFNLYHNYDFVFNNPYQFLDRYHGEEDYFSGKGTALSERRVWDTSFIADIEKLQFHDWTRKGPGATNVELEFCDNIISAHITKSPVGAYKKAHRHGLGADILVLEGKGYSLMWLEGTPMERYDWGPFSMFSPPHMWFHQHFNTGEEPLKMLAFKPFGQKFQVMDYDRLFVSTGGGGHLIEFPDEDPKVKATFEEELRKEGVPLNMPDHIFKR